jgi:hypothetical protein
MASESLTNTNISETYVGVLHAKGEAIPATGLQDVYDGFGNKSALKIGQAGKGIDIDGSLGASFINTLYPVGAVIFSADNTNPGVRFSGTTWIQEAAGRFIAGVGTGNDGTNTQAVPAGNDSTGKYKHSLTEAELPSHNHNTFKDISSSTNNTANFAARKDASGGSQNYAIQSTTETPDVFPTSNTGSGTAHNNTPPSFGLYVWKRTA